MFASHNMAKFTIFKRKMCKIFKYILHIHYRILYIIIPNVYTIILFYGLTTFIFSLNLCTVGACAIFLLHAISVLVSSFGDNRFCISISSLQYLATPSIGIGYLRPFIAIIPAFIPRLLINTMFSLLNSFSNQFSLYFRAFCRINSKSNRSSFVITSFLQADVIQFLCADRPKKQSNIY